MVLESAADGPPRQIRVAEITALFDETVAGMTVPVGGEDLTVSAALNRLTDRDRSVREAAAKGVSEAFGGRVRLFSLITNTLAKDKEIVDTWRRYPRPASARKARRGPTAPSASSWLSPPAASPTR